jgi:hypothetical protein
LLPRYAAAAAASDEKAAAAEKEMEQNIFEAPIPEIAEHNFEARNSRDEQKTDDRRQ